MKHPDLVFAPHFLKMVVDVNASGPPHILKLWLGVSMVILPVKYFCLSFFIVVCQLNLMEIIGVLQRWGKIWPPSVLGILLDLRKQGCLSVCLPHDDLCVCPTCLCHTCLF